MNKIIALINVLIVILILILAAVFSSGCHSVKPHTGKIVLNEVLCSTIISCKNIASETCQDKYEIYSYSYTNKRYKLLYFCSN